jgi:hypothetical protein
VRPLLPVRRLLRSGALVVSLLALLPLAVPAEPAVATVSTPRELLGLLEVREEVTLRYSRSSFRHWVDADKDCQDSRVEVLVREDLSASRHGCRAVTGRWVSWLDGRTFTSSRVLDVDHLVALKEAWGSGAYGWTAAEREAFANDLGYEWALRAVSASSNRSKSDRDPSEWLPMPSIRCEYVSRWMAVKYRWGLSVDSRERAALVSVIDGDCGSRTLVLPARARPSAARPVPAAPGTGVPPTVSTVVTPGSSDAVVTVTPGAFCSPPGATGSSARGVLYTCKRSETDTRNRWRR